jgi:hypothetical protein
MEFLAAVHILNVLAPLHGNVCPRDQERDGTSRIFPGFGAQALLLVWCGEDSTRADPGFEPACFFQQLFKVLPLVSVEEME